MKKLFLIIVLFAGIYNGFSQTPVTLTFQAKDSLTQNALALDSVTVKNLAVSCDTTLYDAVSVLNLVALWPVGIADPGPGSAESFTIEQNVPNPFCGRTLVRIYLRNAGELNLAVYDNQGKKRSQYRNSFDKGWQLFGVSTDESRMLFLSVSDNVSVKTIKMLSTGNSSETDLISYEGAAGKGPANFKSAPDATGFIYYLGNQLQYTGYVNGFHEMIFYDSPVASETYTFAMLPVSTPTVPSVSTTAVSNIAQTTATSGGNITSDGGATVTARGVCWGTSASPTTAGSHTSDGGGMGSFVSNLTGLTPNTPYYIRAYAINSVGTAYGNELQFATLGNYALPVVTTATVTNIAQNTATSGGNVTSDGGAFVSARGVCWSTSPNPTTAGNYTVDGTGGGSFVSNLTGLAANTPYYVRAYATNIVGTTYGNELTFTTLSATLPAVTTTPAGNIAQTTATSGGNVTFDGGATVTARGVCWSTSPAPSISGSHTSDGTGGGLFVSNITGLVPNTPYYIRAYATNIVGTAYGNELTFNTLSPTVPAVTTTPASNITQTSATTGGNVTSDGGATVTARGVCWSTSPAPSIAGSHTTDGGGTGTFTSNLSGLTPSTVYYIRAYATNSLGTSYGDELSFSTGFVCGDAVSYGNQNYNTVLIGTQCWFRENLNVGTMLNTPAVPVNNGIIEKHCINNNPSNCAAYGGLYYWNEMMEYSMTPGAQGICPVGWHVPTDEEYGILVNFLGGTSLAGGAMKETGTAHWDAPNGGATNSSGFTGVGTGVLFYGSQFSWFRNICRLASSTSCGVTLAAVWCYDLNAANATVERLDSAKDTGMPARCVKD